MVVKDVWFGLARKSVGTRSEYRMLSMGFLNLRLRRFWPFPDSDEARAATTFEFLTEWSHAAPFCVSSLFVIVSSNLPEWK